MTNAGPPQGKDEFERPANLHLDLQNPRVPDEAFENEDTVLEYLVDHADVDELVQSILSSGWLDYEPLIVLEGSNVVLEGNRRLAALRIISDAALRGRLKIELPTATNASATPDYVRIRRVKSRNDARDFIGFKHINGPFKWDALAKAKYAAEWFRGHVQKVRRSCRHFTMPLGDSDSELLARRFRSGRTARKRTRELT